MNRNSVMIKSNRYGIVVILDDELPFEELLKSVAERFEESAHFFKDARMAFTFRGRILTKKQEKELVSVIESCTKIHVLCIVDERKEEEEYYKKAIAAAGEEKDASDGQFYKGTLRAGQVLETETSVIILGDVCLGGSIVSKGNVIVLGALKGNVYAGASGRRNCFVAALNMRPGQIRIADRMIKDGFSKKQDSGDKIFEPRVACIKGEHIYVKPISSDALSNLTFHGGYTG